VIDILRDLPPDVVLEKTSEPPQCLTMRKTAKLLISGGW